MARRARCSPTTRRPTSSWAISTSRPARAIRRWRSTGFIGSVGAILGEKIVLNEFYAYQHLVPLKDSLSPRSFTIATFALCGFANFSSIGIQIGGIGALVYLGLLYALGLRYSNPITAAAVAASAPAVP